MPREDWTLLVSLAVALIEVVAILVALRAIMTARTSQGAIAWSVALVSFPYVSLPLYALFGRNRFQGYVLARRRGNLKIHHLVSELERNFPPALHARLDTERYPFNALERLARIPFINTNRVDLLVNGEATFDAIFDALSSARRYVLIQFYIVRDDRIGQRLQQALADCAARGVRVYFLYDAIGSYELPTRYIERLQQSGVAAYAFNSRRERRNRFQINFRNHRKIVVVDGERALLGGLNVGDEYLGRDRKLSPWRDTHIDITGPSALAVQMAFLEDWHWAAGEVPELDWQAPTAVTDDAAVLIIPSGPADEQETGSLLFTQMIGMARKRLWIVSPYFVPDSAVMNALKLAVLRGVDVRIMVPKKSDNTMVRLAMQSYVLDALRAGIGVFRYTNGFLHQKVALIDDEIATVGTSNLDNRSLRLNFEITAMIVSHEFAQDVQAMLGQDFGHCEPIGLDELMARRLPMRILSRVARLFSPVL